MKWYFLWALAVACLMGCSKKKPIDVQVDVPVDYLMKATSDSRLRVSGTRYVSSVLTSVFGEGIFQTQTVQSLIGTQFSTFGGGSCDPYVPGECPGTSAVNTPDSFGFSRSGESLLDSVPSLGSGRSALVTRACDKLVSHDPALLIAASQITGNGTGSPWAAPTDVGLVAAFQLFYPARTPSTEVITELRSVSTQAAQYGYQESWRFVLLTVCLSPAWQIL